jgi:hypothetical protein
MVDDDNNNNNNRGDSRGSVDEKGVKEAAEIWGKSLVDFSSNKRERYFT